MLRKLLLPALLVCSSTGCADNLDAILRDARNIKSEMIDVLMKINSDEDAKLAKEKLLPKAKDHFDEVVKSRFDKWEKGLGTKRISVIAQHYAKEKQEPLNLLKYDRAVFKQAIDKIKKEEREEMQEVFDSFIDYYTSGAAAAIRLEDAVARLDQLVQKFTNEKIEELRAQGVENPRVDPKEYWPMLEQVRTKEIDSVRKIGLDLSGFRGGVGSSLGGIPGLPGGGPPGGEGPPGGGPPGGGPPGGGPPGGGPPGGGPPAGFPGKQ